jgi:preprotein translocase subunit Sss1
LKDDWKKESRVSQTPTWQEYSAWAVFPGMWDVNGLGLAMESGQVIKNVKWRGNRA